jgi:hypothetical protein
MAVDVESAATNFGAEVRRARTESLVALRDDILDFLRDHPEHQDEILAQLRTIRLQFREEGREDLEDFVLDAMDIVTGWVAPEMRLS